MLALVLMEADVHGCILHAVAFPPCSTSGWPLLRCATSPHSTLLNFFSEPSADTLPCALGSGLPPPPPQSNLDGT